MDWLQAELRKLSYLTKLINLSILKKILFETHHLYYWPNFRPIVDEMIVSENFEIHVSMPRRNLTLQQNILKKQCDNLSIKFITADSEQKRVEKIYNEAFDIIIVGNVGKLNKIVNDKTIAIMVYHGIGLKQSYYKDINSSRVFGSF